MKHQRKRRFRSSMRKKIENSLEDGYRNLLKEQGIEITEKRHVCQFDSNCISPGTAFLFKLCEEVCEHFTSDMSNYPFKKVVVSGCNVFGEGEQKIVRYMRSEQLREDFDVNSTHCICGMDADFIFLALSLHNPHIFVSRGRGERGMETLLSVQNLRTSLAKDFANPNLSFIMDFERLFDDFVFLFMLVGNDFVPSVPFVDLLERTHIEYLVKCYEDILWEWNEENPPYLIDREKMNIKNIGRFFELFSGFEKVYLEKVKIKDAPEVYPDTSQIPKKSLEEIINQAVSDFDSSRDVLVKKFPNFYKEADILRTFSQFGEIEKVNFSRKSCFIRFKEKKTVDKVVVLDKIFKLEGEPVRLLRSGFMDDRNVIIKNPHGLIDHEQLSKLLIEKCGHVKSIVTKKEEGVFVVSFHNVETVQKSLGIDTILGGGKLIIAKSMRMKDAEYHHRFERMLLTFDESYLCNEAPIKFEKYVFETEKYKELYYEAKFGSNFDLSDVKLEFLRGLQWVLNYYFTNKCLSYRWFFKYDYAPFLSDMKEIEKIEKEIAFPKDVCFTPLQQLILILPDGSKNLLPKSYLPVVEKYAELFDETQIKFDFYRNVGFRVFASLEWTAIEKLKSFDYEMLLKEIESIPLDEYEKERNSFKRNVKVEKLDEKKVNFEEFDIPEIGEFKSEFLKGAGKSKISNRPIRIRFT